MSESQYRSNRSVAKNPTVSISVDDPRLAWDQIGLTKATIGAEIEIIGLNGIPVLTGGTTVINPGGPSYPIVPPDPTGPINEALPEGITNLVAEWSDDDIVLTFNFDTQNGANSGIYRFLVKIRDSSNNKEYLLRAGFGYESTFLSTSSSEQTLTIPNSDIQQTGIPLSQNINQVGVASCNVYKCNDYVTATVPEYVSPFPKPIFALSKGVDYYAVTLDPVNLALALTKNFYGIIIEENITEETNAANVSLTEGWRQATAITTNSTSVIYTPSGGHRWVRVKYVALSANNSVYSDIADITPDPFMPVNTTPPTIFTSASIAWDSNDIKVSFVRPSENAGTTIKIKLVPYINDVESTSLSAFYYKILGPLDTEHVIKSLELYGQFGAYYSKFKGYISALSAQGVESTSSIISGPVTRANQISTVYPTLGTPNVNSPIGVFRVSPISNGYIVDFDLPPGASRLEVYEKPTAWTVVPTNDDNMVYSGLSPATIITSDNDTRYVIVRYYDQYDNNSYYSMEKAGQTSGVEVNPIDIGVLSLIENPIKIATDGSIFAGIGDSTQYPQVFFNKDGIFAYDSSGDWTTQVINSASSGSPTFITKSAQIADWIISPTKIENTLNLISKTATGVSGQSTIIVDSSTDIAVGQRVRGTGIGTGATVASISGTTITLSVPNSGTVSGTVSFKATLYTGLSGTAAYAFWAGSDTAGNSDGMANFSVTPAGAVVAKKISIVGDGTNNDLINSGGGTFKVTNAGGLTATSATISGSITVNSQSYFNANVNISSGSYLISGGTGTDKVKIGSQGLLAENQSGVASTKIYSDPQVSERTVSHNGIIIPKTTSGVTLWSQKAVFGTSVSHGWTIADNYIYSNYISLNGSDSDQSITIVTKDANSAKGVQISSGVATDIAIKVGNFATPSFTVTHNGAVFAQEAEVVGTIKASLGGIGTFNSSNQLTSGWQINAAGLTAVGLGARITVGDYSIRSTNSDGSDFTIYDNQLLTPLFATDSVVGAGGDARRIFLGSPTRHVEVAKSAQISGEGSRATISPTTANVDISAYRSGGLRNIFTVTDTRSAATGGVGAQFPSALKGDMLVVYDTSVVYGNWRKVDVYLNTTGSTGITYYYARYTENRSTGVCISAPAFIETVTSVPSGTAVDSIITVNPLSSSYTRGYYSTISAADAVSKLSPDSLYCNAAPVIATSSSIITGNSNPSIIVTSTGFKTTASTTDFTVSVGTTGLTLSSVTNTSTTSKTLVFNGTITAGTLQITAKASAFDPVASAASNTLTLSSSAVTTTTTTAAPGTTYYLAEAQTYGSMGSCVSAPAYVSSTTTTPSTVGSIFVITSGTIYKYGYYSTVSSSDAVSKLLAEIPSCQPTTTTTTTTTTAAPSFGITGTPTSTSSTIEFSWANAPANTVIYGVYYKTGGSTSSVFTTTSTSYKFTGLTANTDYTIYVEARNSSMQTLATSSAAAATTAASTTAAPTTAAPTTAAPTTTTTATPTTATPTTTTTASGVTYSAYGPDLASNVTCPAGKTKVSGSNYYVSSSGTYSVSNGSCGTLTFYAYTSGIWYYGCCQD